MTINTKYQYLPFWVSQILGQKVRPSFTKTQPFWGGTSTYSRSQLLGPHGDDCLVSKVVCCFKTKPDVKKVYGLLNLLFLGCHFEAIGTQVFLCDILSSDTKTTWFAISHCPQFRPSRLDKNYQWQEAPTKLKSQQLVASKIKSYAWNDTKTQHWKVLFGHVHDAGDICLPHPWLKLWWGQVWKSKRLDT